MDFLQYTASLPGGSGQWTSCKTLPHCLGAVGSGPPSMHSPTAWGQWAVDLLQCTASLPGGSGQWTSFNAVLCCGVPCFVVPLCAMSCRGVPRCAASRRVVLWCVPLGVRCRGALHSGALQCDVSCCLMLCRGRGVGWGLWGLDWPVLWCGTRVEVLWLAGGSGVRLGGVAHWIRAAGVRVCRSGWWVR